MARRGDSIELLPSGKYRARYWTRDGRHPSKTFTIRSDAVKWRRQAIVDAERSGIDAAPSTATLQSVIDPWWESKERSVKPRTAERYLLHVRLIERELGALKLREVTYERLQVFVDSLSPRYAPATVSAIYGVLNLILTAAQRRGKLPALPKPDLPRVGKPKLTVPTRDEVEALAAAIAAPLHAPVLLAAYCGLREGELLALHTRDVHLDEGTVFVHQARNKSSGALESTKTERSRNVYLPARVAEALEQHLRLFPGERVVPVSASVLQKQWERARARCGLEGVRFHDLRHHAASCCIAAGWSVLQVSKQLGHANATMTLNVYAHLWPDSYDDAIRKLDEYLAHD